LSLFVPRPAPQGLAPAVWRIGGTPADTVVYEYGSPPECAVHVEKPYPQTKCLSQERWLEILAFAKAAGVSLSFGISGLYGRPSPSEPMNISNAEAFMAATASLDPSATEALFAYQLGNELGNGRPGHYRANPEVLAADVLRLRTVINGLWADDRRPLFVGPDSSPSKDYYKPYLSVAAPALNATTFHSYACGSRGNGGGPCQNLLLSADGIRGDDGAAHDTVDYAADSPAPDLAVWGGEVGPAYGGGVTGLSNRFGDMLWWVDHLARLQAIGVQTFARSTLLGGSYELVNRSTHDPNPSYFASLAYHRLMGARSFQTAVTGSTDVLAHSTCTAAGRSPAPAARGIRSGRTESGRLTHEHVFAGQSAARRLRDSTIAASPCASALDAAAGAVTAVVMTADNATSTNLTITVGANNIASGHACVWHFRSLAEVTRDGPLYGSTGVQWLDGSSSSWTTLSVGPAPGFALPALASPVVVPVTDGGVPVTLGPLEYAFVVIPDAGVPVCAH